VGNGVGRLDQGEGAIPVRAVAGQVGCHDAAVTCQNGAEVRGRPSALREAVEPDKVVRRERWQGERHCGERTEPE